jgi:hypothetical protein
MIWFTKVRLLESVGAASVRINRTESRILRSVLMTLFSGCATVKDSLQVDQWIGASGE